MLSKIDEKKSVPIAFSAAGSGGNHILPE